MARGQGTTVKKIARVGEYSERKEEELRLATLGK